MIITHPEKAVATLVKLKQRGVSITVDDFGTGYSSLSYLARLPIQAVKIDQRFVHGLEQNRNDEAITQAIIALSHSLGLRVIAEGVETAAQFEFLKRHGCEEAQGFLISRPLEEPELRNWWRMQEEENRIVGRQSDMWQPRAEAQARGVNEPTGIVRARTATDPTAYRRRAGCPDRRRRCARRDPAARRRSFRALVAGQRRERGVARFAEPHRMAALAAMKRRRNRRAVAERRRHARDRRRRDPRHVGERDEPAARFAVAARTPQARLAPMPSSAFAQRTMRAPFAPSAAASARRRGARRRRRREPRRADGAARRRRPARRESPVASRASSLSPPKRVAAAGGEQDADDPHGSIDMLARSRTLHDSASLGQQPELAVLHRRRARARARPSRCDSSATC